MLAVVSKTEEFAKNRKCWQVRGSKKHVFTGEGLFLMCGNRQSQSKLFCNKEERSEIPQLKNKIIFITCSSQMSLRGRWETSIHCFVFCVLALLLLFKVSHFFFFLWDFTPSVYFPCHRYNNAVSCNPQAEIPGRGAPMPVPHGIAAVMPAWHGHRALGCSSGFSKRVNSNSEESALRHMSGEGISWGGPQSEELSNRCLSSCR